MHIARRSALAIGMMALSACNSASLQDVAPSAAVVLPETATAKPSPNPSAPASDPQTDAAGPTGAGTYPNLNVRPDAATRQMTDEEKAAEIARLNAARAGQGAKAGTTPAEMARLKKLARSHAGQALEEIEN